MRPGLPFSSHCSRWCPFSPCVSGQARARGRGVVVGSWVALGASVATPGRVATRLFDGVRQFYDVDLPFDPTSYPRMQSAVLLALFAFCLLLALALAVRRALLAVLSSPWGRLAGDAGLGRQRAPDRRADPRWGARHPGRHSSERQARLLPRGRRGRARGRLRARPGLPAGGRQGGVPELAGMGPVHADRSFRRRQLCLELGLQRARLAEEADGRTEDRGSGRTAVLAGHVLEAFVRSGWAEDLQTMEPLVFWASAPSSSPRR